ncbi:MAG: hypothetical protein NWS22_09385 [Porticoccaceae bacterium]|nr:hypothetical protein [Porticoccaceae bacterium]
MSVRNIAIVTLALITGLGAFSRSFFLVAILLILYFVLINPMRKKLLISIVLLAIAPLVGSLEFSVDYFAFIWERLVLSLDFDSNQRVMGETGIIAVVEGILEAPLLGSGVAVAGGDIKAQVSGVVIRPHVGILSVIAFYGLIASSGIIYIQLRSILLAFTSRRPHSYFSDNHSLFLPLSGACFAATFICLFEPLIDSNITLSVFILLIFFKSLNIKNREKT